MGVGVIERQDRLGQVQSLVRAFSILDALRGAEDGMTLTEVAGVARLPRSTTHRLLATMNALRYVEFDPGNNRWLVGLQAFALGASFMKNRDVARLGRPIMRSLMIDSGETVNIGNASGAGISYIAQVRPQHDQGTAVPTGAVMPFNTTASGKALVAFHSDEDIDRLLGETALDRGTGAAAATPEAFAAELERVRRQGFAVDDQEHRAGIRCIAAPVYDRTGAAVAVDLGLCSSADRPAHRPPEPGPDKRGCADERGNWRPARGLTSCALFRSAGIVMTRRRREALRPLPGLPRSPAPVEGLA